MPRNKCEDDRALRGRLTEEDGVLARPDSPSRCTLPITALRVTPPSSAAIRLAESPSAHSFFRSSTRSSVHIWPLHQRSTVEGRVRPAESPIVSSEGQSGRRTARSTRWNSGNGPPQNEMSYLRVSRVQYGGSPAQESGPAIRPVPARFPQQCPANGLGPGRGGVLTADRPTVKCLDRVARRGVRVHF